MATDQQGLSQPSNGAADWDTDLNGNFGIIERGYRGKFVFGTNVVTGQVLWVNSGRFAFPFNPASEDALPHAFAYKSVASGEEDFALLSGIVRSLDVLSACVPGLTMYSNFSGTLVTSYSAASRPVGIGMYQDGFYFDPARVALPELIASSISISAIVNSTHLFSIDLGKRGIVRRLEVKGDSADLCIIKFHSGSARVASELLYEVKSGGVVVQTHFIDQAMFPYRNTEASTLSGLMFGTIQCPSGTNVTTDTIVMRIFAERFR